jgi:hypothetical protein
VSLVSLVDLANLVDHIEEVAPADLQPPVAHSRQNVVDHVESDLTKFSLSYLSRGIQSPFYPSPVVRFPSCPSPAARFPGLAPCAHAPFFLDPICEGESFAGVAAVAVPPSALSLFCPFRETRPPYPFGLLSPVRAPSVVVALRMVLSSAAVPGCTRSVLAATLLAARTWARQEGALFPYPWGAGSRLREMPSVGCSGEEARSRQISSLTALSCHRQQRPSGVLAVDMLVVYHIARARVYRRTRLAEETQQRYLVDLWHHIVSRARVVSEVFGYKDYTRSKSSAF